MAVGGNGRARQFFKEHGWYELGSDKIEQKVSDGTPFLGHDVGLVQVVSLLPPSKRANLACIKAHVATWPINTQAGGDEAAVFMRLSNERVSALD